MTHIAKTEVFAKMVNADAVQCSMVTHANIRAEHQEHSHYSFSFLLLPLLQLLLVSSMLRQTSTKKIREIQAE